MLTSVYQVCACVSVVSGNEICACACVCLPANAKKKMICRRSTNCRPTSTTLPREPRSQRVCWGGEGGGGVDERGIQTLAHRQTQNIASQRNARAHSPTLRRIRMHARTHARTHAHMHTCTHARKNARTHAHTHTHTETHTHTHTHRHT